MTAVKSKFDKSVGPPPKKKPSRKPWYWGGAGIALLALFVLLYKPQATIQYGICKTYIELNEPYPGKLRYLSMEDFGDMIRIFYRKTDPFGVVSVNTIECSFKVDENGLLTPYLKSVDLNGKYRPYLAEDPKKIALFNESVPAILASPPDLTMPYFPLDNIRAYHDFQEDALQ